ncbi:hypothetical protein FRC01_003817 [Tulasnella sp. 417]|nr:hypothetical protein FRC01_003817 [Tulasnella sp. 417]
MSTPYDESLLAGVPEVANAEKQAGYNINILNGGSAPRQNAAQEPQATNEQFAALEAHHPKASRPSFWKSTRGKLIIGLAVFLVLAAAIGGGVGGALGKKSKPTTTGQGITGSDGSSGSDTNQGTSPQSSDGSGQR